MSTNVKDLEILTNYLPKPVVNTIYQWLKADNIQLRISRNRKTKLGDYRPPSDGKPHRISVNHDLNCYGFLITLVHEIAHAKTWDLHKRGISPHGNEWKTEFKNLMSTFLNQDVFPEEILQALEHYFKNTFASSSTDLDLSRILKKYDNRTSGIMLEEIPYNTIFSIADGRTFRKQDKLRKRYRCICLNNKRQYLFNPLTQITPVEPEE